MSAGSPERAASGAAAGEPQLFVINLCASTSPLALVHPSDPQLKRHTFFVTRQREDGRERFRLHMGYFPTQEEAEALLAVVRDIYPAAWAGPAPTSGAPRRARNVAVAAAATAAMPPAVAAPAAAAAPAPTAPAAATDASPTLSRMSNVRAVLRQLSDEASPSAQVQSAAVPPAAAPPADASVPTLAPVAPAPARQPAPPRKACAAAAPRAPELTPVQTVQLLENDSKAPVRAAEIPDVPEGDSVRVVTPEDTQTLRDIKLDAERNAPPCYAVQLLWSVTPIDAGAHPHLAIFDAYKLYNVEGSRHGRRWYGLRLGFFKDPNSATQVAYYVRSDYPTVAVVPVAERERDNASGTGGEAARKAAAPPQKPQLQTGVERDGLQGFELLEDDRPPPIKRDVGDAPAAAPKSPAAKAPAAKAPATRPAPKPGLHAGGKPTGKRVVVRKPEAKGRVTPGAAVPLDETLELLGASTLTIDESREVINDSALRRRPGTEKKAAAGSGGRLSRLLNRLGGR